MRRAVTVVGWLALAMGGAGGCGDRPVPAGDGRTPASPAVAPEEDPMPDAARKPSEALATFGGGCFWCVEAVFKELDGVTSVVPGYSGGHAESPTYRQVCSGTTGHAEVVQIRYDPAKVRYEQLLEVFFRTHDPTTKDRQGNDVGTQYRSVVFFHDEAQRQSAERVKAALDAEAAYPRPIVTEIVPFERFHLAEEYHRDYFARNPENPYCAAVIPPKLEKLKKVFGDLVAK
jgi:peptide-methionine (S)-S-oxide reductase